MNILDINNFPYFILAIHSYNTCEYLQYVPVCGTNVSDSWQCLWGGETINTVALLVARSIFLIAWLVLCSWGLPSKIFRCFGLPEMPFPRFGNEWEWGNNGAVTFVQGWGGVAGDLRSIKICTVSKQSLKIVGEGKRANGAWMDLKVKLNCLWGHCEINVDKMKKYRKTGL